MAEPLVPIARIVAPHGVQGEVKADLLTDFPERFGRTKEVWVGAPPTLFAVQGARVVGRQVLLQLRGVGRRDQAEGLRGQLVQVPQSQAWPLPLGEYYWHEILGLEVCDPSGQALGMVSDILRTGSNDVYVVRGAEGEWLLPATREVIKEIDLDHGRLAVQLLPGMGPET